jgi:hypothetical protein
MTLPTNTGHAFRVEQMGRGSIRLLNRVMPGGRVAKNQSAGVTGRWREFLILSKCLKRMAGTTRLELARPLP